MPKLLDLDVSVSIEGRRLPEYDVEVSDSASASGDSEVPVITCWIPSEVNKHFKIDIVPPPPPLAHHLYTNLFLDGFRTYGVPQIIRKHNPLARSIDRDRAVEGGRRYERPFMFAPLQVVTGDETASTETDRIGEIEIRVFRIDSYGPSTSTKKCSRRRTHLSGRVNDNSEGKGLTHCIQLGEAHEIESQSKPPLMRGKSKEHIATFIFRYRDIDTLVARGIAPRDALASTTVGPEPSSENEAILPSPRKRAYSDVALQDEMDTDCNKEGSQRAGRSPASQSDVGPPKPKKGRYDDDDIDVKEEYVEDKGAIGSPSAQGYESGSLNPRKRTYNDVLVEVGSDAYGEESDWREARKRVKRTVWSEGSATPFPGELEVIDVMDID
ncbi:hypothetical protein CC1G_07832 [Coprinopsis cinerea okayama7|uniref:DUF7918 domain-containing protein n=1 Tax=Coprinopsis cinerea (strain Okayama-7 / 130 / ATCC MYA-4618 / FGSC 9003) TaxID=240176 RepID=A8P3Z4_COPC7|nr:hypothetical protein CC1G_07832 [Coprinopsis cinerea okayama7\|eukprot:XP_001838641.1 hypothetical protein CC1G_07832 [Coprinopsis cinerea okayama7\